MEKYIYDKNNGLWYYCVKKSVPDLCELRTMSGNVYCVNTIVFFSTHLEISRFLI
jgi:hypothetical protein